MPSFDSKNNATNIAVYLVLLPLKIYPKNMSVAKKTVQESYREIFD